MKRLLSTLIITSLVSSCMAVTSFGASTFYDINDVPWEGAKTYINSVSDLGLMVGDQNLSGKQVFRAKDKVTYCEAMQLAYSTMQKTNKLGDTAGVVSKWTTIMAGNKIPTWAYPAVSYGLDKGILSISDVSRFMNSKGGNNNATREDVSVIMGKTLAQLYTLDKNATLSFKDKSSITASSAPYVALLVNHNILVGDGDGNFNPKNYINRAEMAVLISKTYTKINGGVISTGDTISGKVLSVYNYGEKLMVTIDSNGSSVGYIGDDNIPVTYQGNDENWSDITAGDEITITLNASKQPVSAVLTYDAEPSTTEVIKGTVDSISNEQIVVNKNSGGYDVYTLQVASGSLLLDGSKATIRDFSDTIDDGFSISVDVTVKGGKRAIKVEGSTTTDTETGTLSSLTSSEVIFKRGGRTYTYNVSAGAKFKLDGESASVREINNALDDDLLYVTVTFDSNGEVRIIEARYEDYVEDYDGVIEDIDEDEISIDTGSRTRTYDLVSSPTFRLDGSNSTLSKIKSAMDKSTLYVRLTYNTSDKVIIVDALTTIGTERKGKITKITDTKIYFKENGSASTDRYDFDEDDMIIKINRYDRSFSLLQSFMRELGTLPGSISLDSDNYVTSIIVSTEESVEDTLYGQLYAVDDDQIRFLEFDTASSNKKYYSLASSSKLTIKIKDDKADIDDLQEYYDDNNNVYAKIVLENNKVVSINASTRKTDITPSSSSSTVTGAMITDISSSSISYKTSVSSSERTKDMARGATVTLDGQSSDIEEIEDLIYDDIVMEGTLYVSGDEVTSLKLTSYDTMKGKFNYIIEGSINITPSNTNRQTKYDTIDSRYLTIKIDGADVTRSELESRKDDISSVTISLNSSKNVVSVIAKTR